MAKECNNTSCDKASCEGCSSSKKQQSFQAEMNAQSNVKHVHKRSWINYSHYFETLSLLPIIPSISYTYKF